MHQSKKTKQEYIILTLEQYKSLIIKITYEVIEDLKKRGMIKGVK